MVTLQKNTTDSNMVDIYDGHLHVGYVRKSKAIIGEMIEQLGGTTPKAISLQRNLRDYFLLHSIHIHEEHYECGYSLQVLSAIDSLALAQGKLGVVLVAGVEMEHLLETNGYTIITPKHQGQCIYVKYDLTPKFKASSQPGNQPHFIEHILFHPDTKYSLAEIIEQAALSVAVQNLTKAITEPIKFTGTQGSGKAYGVLNQTDALYQEALLQLSEKPTQLHMARNGMLGTEETMQVLLRDLKRLVSISGLETSKVTHHGFLPPWLQKEEVPRPQEISSYGRAMELLSELESLLRK